MEVLLTEEIVSRFKKISDEDPSYLFNKFFEQDDKQIKKIKEVISVISEMNYDNFYYYNKNPLSINFYNLTKSISVFLAQEVFNIECDKKDSLNDIIFSYEGENSDYELIDEAKKFKHYRDLKNELEKLISKLIEFHTQIKLSVNNFDWKELIQNKVSFCISTENFSSYFMEQLNNLDISINREIAEHLIRAYAFTYRTTPILNPNSPVFSVLSPIIEPYKEYVGNDNSKYHEIFEAFRVCDYKKVLKMYAEYMELNENVLNGIREFAKNSKEHNHITYTCNFFEQEFAKKVKILKLKNENKLRNYNTDVLKNINIHDIYHSRNIIGKFIQKKTGFTEKLNKVKSNVESMISSYMDDPIDEVYKNFMPLNDIENVCVDFLKTFHISSFITNSTFKVDKSTFLNNIQTLKEGYLLTASKIGIKREYLGKDTNIVFTPHIFYSGMYDLAQNLISFNPIYLSMDKSLDKLSSTILHEWIHHLDFVLSQKHSKLLGSSSEGSIFNTFTNRFTIKGVFFSDRHNIHNQKNINSLLAHNHIIETILNGKSQFKAKQEEKKNFVLQNLLKLNRDLREDPSFEFTDEEKNLISYERIYNNCLFMESRFYITNDTDLMMRTTATFNELIKHKEIYFPRFNHKECHFLQSVFKLIKFSSNEEGEIMYFTFDFDNQSNQYQYLKKIIKMRSVYSNSGSIFVFLAKLDDYFENTKCIKHFLKENTPNITKEKLKLKLKENTQNYNKLQFKYIEKQTYEFQNGINYYQSPDEIFARYFENGFFPQQNFRDLLNLKFIGLTPFFTNFDKTKEHLDLLILSIFGEECLAKRNQAQNHPAINFTNDEKIVNCETYSINKDELLDNDKTSIKDFNSSIAPTDDLIAHAKEARLKLEKTKSHKTISQRLIRLLKGKTNNPETKAIANEGKLVTLNSKQQQS